MRQLIRRGSALAALLPFLLLASLAGCNGNAQTKGLKSAADLQKAAAGAYAEAKAQEAVDVKACLVATAPNVPDPTNGKAFAAACAAAGAPLRYDPDKLHDAGKPVLGLYDAVKAARAGVDGAWATVIAYVAALLSDTEIVKLPPGVIDLGRALLGGGR